MRTYIKGQLDEKWSLFSTEIHPAAFCLDPRFRKIPVAQNEKKIGEDFICKCAGGNWEKPGTGSNGNKLSTEYLIFRTFQGIYSNEYELDKNPMLYWKNLLYVKGTNVLAELALRILSFPQSCASLERSFSPVRVIHTCRRNKLKRDKLSQLVYIYFNHRSLASYAEVKN